jgi:hypothetical protein
MLKERSMSLVDDAEFWSRGVLVADWRNNKPKDYKSKLVDQALAGLQKIKPFKGYTELPKEPDGGVFRSGKAPLKRSKR